MVVWYTVGEAACCCVSTIMSQNDLSPPKPSIDSTGPTAAKDHSADSPVLSERHSHAVVWGLLLLSLFVFFWRLGSARLFDLDEGIYVAASRQMVLSGDYITPRLNSRPLRDPSQTVVPFYEKPILVYWLCAGSLRLFGQSEWAARLPVALSGLLTTWLIVFIGMRWFGRRAGLLAGLVYATSPMILVDSRQMTTDNLLSLWFLLAMYAFWSLYSTVEEGRGNKETISAESQKSKNPGEGPTQYPDPPIGSRQSKLANPKTLHSTLHTPHSTLHSLLFWAACALAVLTKGVIGLLLPGLVIGVTLLLKTLSLRIRWRQGRSPLLLFRLGLNRFRDWWPTVPALRPVPGVLLFLLLVVPWHLAIWKAGGQDANGRTWIQEYIIRQHVGRFKGQDTVHNAPLPTFFVYFLIGFFPWACLTPAAFRAARAESPAQRQTHRFLLIWFWTIFVFFSLGAAKLPTYIAPTYPAAALLVGRWLEGLLGAEANGSLAAKRSLPRGMLGAVITAAILLLAGLLLAFHPRLSTLVPPQVAQITLHLTCLLFLGSLAAWFCVRKGIQEPRWRQAGIGALVVMMLGLVGIFSGEGYEAANHTLLEPYQSLAKRAEADGKKGVPVVFYNIIPRRPSMLYYAGDYPPVEQEEIPLLPLLNRLQPSGRIEADVVTLRSTLEKQLQPELAATPDKTFEVLAETGEPHSGWVLLRVRSR
jgi:4-amino-4-deoxy-L-arabinose transferase-like glycosyltransferase